MTVGIRGHSHTAFNVRDLGAAVEFYCGKLGLEKAFEVVVPEMFAGSNHPLAPLVGQLGMVYVRLGNRNFLELFHTLPDTDASAGGANFYDRGFAHICLEVDDLPGYVELLRKRGVTIDEEVTRATDGSFQAWIRDVDDNRIELMEYTSESLQTPFL